MSDSKKAPDSQSEDRKMARAYLLNRERLPMIVLYKRPTDFPDEVVARLHFSLPSPEPTEHLIRDDEVETLMRRIERLNIGLTWLNRSPSDDAKIVGLFL